MVETAYSKDDVLAMDAFAPEDKTEDYGIEMDVPDGYQYGDYPITEVSWWFDRLHLIYEGEDLIGDFAQLTFTCDVDDEGHIVVRGPPPGIVAESAARKRDTPGANESEELYDLMEELGIIVDMEGDRDG